MENDIQNETLKDKVANIRIKAREILRMDMINNRLAKINNLNSELTNNKKNIENLKKNLVIFTYEKTKKLDVDHPDYENINKKTEEAIANETKCVEDDIKYLEDYITKEEKTIADLNEEIAQIESGDKKVSLDALNELATKLINKI